MRLFAFIAGTMARKTNTPKPGVPISAERRAAALRENLRRRKRQQRLRDAAENRCDTKAPAKDDN